MVRPGSYCIRDEVASEGNGETSGVCSNPYAKGCLQAHLPDMKRDIRRVLLNRFPGVQNGRVCNSDDYGDGNEMKDCYVPSFDYPEIRIHNENWVSGVFLSWIHQIILMELVEVPIAIGMGPSGGKKNIGIQDNTYESSFYNPRNAFQFASNAYPWDALRAANRVKDCRLLWNSPAASLSRDEQDERSAGCVHVIPEAWNGQERDWSEAMRAGIIDPVEGNGQVGKAGWFVPFHTANFDQTLLSYYGFRGEENRHKVASTFKRPLTWKDYCDTISPNNCTEPNDTAQRYPDLESERNAYFDPAMYTGYFHFSDKNNCTKNPTTCTGAIIGPICSWSTNVDGQLYWNGLVGLEADGPVEPNGGYTYQSMTEIWRAANATKSHVLMWWWKPEPLLQEFHGTDFEFQPFLLPEATATCSRSRVDTSARCSEYTTVRRGLKAGSCDHEAHALRKIYAVTLQQQYYETTNLALRSPGYHTIQNLKFSDLDINDLLERWLAIGVDRYGTDAREAVCSWVVDNLDLMFDAVPAGYPRVLDTGKSSYQVGYVYAAIIVAAFTNLVVWGTMVATYYYRKTQVMMFAQVYYLMMILLGFVLISIAAIIVVLEPTNGTCTVSAWFAALGYTVELVPLLVKIAAINKILQGSKRMKRVKISQISLYQRVAAFVGLVSILLAVWTILDPPLQVEDRTMAANAWEFDPVVRSNLRCRCKYFYVWKFLAVGGHGVLLVMASVLAFQSRNVQQEFNESRSLGTMIYSHFMFLVLRIAVVILDQAFSSTAILPATIIATIESFVYSLDALAALCIYILPKVREAMKPQKDSTLSVISRTRGVNNARQSAVVSQIEHNAAAAHASWMNEQREDSSSSNNCSHGNKEQSCED